MKTKTTETVSLFLREVDGLRTLLDRAAERIESGSVAPAELEAVIAWEATAHHTFHRFTGGLARLRDGLARAAGIPA